MKKFCISFLVLSIIILAVTGFALNKTQTHNEYLRIHIRADSNQAQAQSVKYEVKNAVVDFLTPIIANVTTKEQAEALLKSNLKKIENVADSVLKKHGFDYTSKASIKVEEFPTRVYGEYTLEQGFYKALIIELGSGKGDNWWCVVYPPLCFTGTNTLYCYKSKIYEIIENFFKNR